MILLPFIFPSNIFLFQHPLHPRDFFFSWQCKQQGQSTPDLLIKLTGSDVT